MYLPGCFPTLPVLSHLILKYATWSGNKREKGGQYENKVEIYNLLSGIIKYLGGFKQDLFWCVQKVGDLILNETKLC